MMMSGQTPSCGRGRVRGAWPGCAQYCGSGGQERGSHCPVQVSIMGICWEMLKCLLNCAGVLFLDCRGKWPFQPSELASMKTLKGEKAYYLYCCNKCKHIYDLFSFYKNLFGLSSEAEKLDQVSQLLNYTLIIHFMFVKYYH